MKKTVVKNAAFLAAVMAILNGCGAEEVNTREETQTVAENEEQAAGAAEDREEFEEDVNSGEESAEDEDKEQPAGSPYDHWDYFGYEDEWNGPGAKDFTIGSYGSSAVNLYALYTIREGGKLDLLGKDMLNCSPGEFSVVFEKGEDVSILGSMWDNAVGERRTVVYVWEEAQKKYVETVD